MSDKELNGKCQETEFAIENFNMQKNIKELAHGNKNKQYRKQINHINY